MVLRAVATLCDLSKALTLSIIISCKLEFYGVTGVSLKLLEFHLMGALVVFP